MYFVITIIPPLSNKKEKGICLYLIFLLFEYFAHEAIALYTPPHSVRLQQHRTTKYLNQKKRIN